MNKKKKKMLLILLGVLAIMCIGIFAVSRYEKKQEEIKTSDATVIAVDADEVTALSWETDDSSLAFYRDDDGVWHYDEDENFPVDEEAMADLLAPYEQFIVDFEIDDADNLSDYGLDDPECVVHITTADAEYEISYGDYSTMDSERYMSIGDGNVYLAAEDPTDDYAIEISDVIDNDDLPELDEVSSMEFSGIEDYTVVYDEDNDHTICDEDVYFTGNKPLDTEKVESYLSEISSVDLSEYVTYNATDEELTAYGFDKPELAVNIEYEDEDGNAAEFTFTIGLNQEEVAEAEEKAEEEETDADAEDSDQTDVTAYIRIGDSQIIYELTSTDRDALTAMTYNDLRHAELFTGDFADVTEIDISLDGEDYTIVADREKNSTTWRMSDESAEAVETADDTDADSDSEASDEEDEGLDISDLKLAITALAVDEYTDEKASGKEEISITIHLDNERYPTYTMTFYRYDGNQCLATVDGKTLALVDRDLVVDLIEAVNKIVL